MATNSKEHSHLSDQVSPSIDGALPEPVARIASVMSSYPAPWALCGGWAVDAWLGAPSREHADVDIAVFVEDGHTLHEHMRGWQLVPHGENWDPADGNQLWDGRRLDVPAHLHARVDTGETVPEGVLMTEHGFFLDIQLCEREGGEWLLSRDPRIALPLGLAITASTWQMPTAVPEVLLLYKAADLRQRDKADFAQLLPRLADEQRRWLRDAIERVGHPWLGQLPAAAST